MSTDAKDTDTTGTPAKKSRMPLILGLAGMLLGGGGAGAAVYLGLVEIPFLPGANGGGAVAEGAHGDGGHAPGPRHASPAPAPVDSEFVALPEIVVPLGSGARARHLRALLHVEAAPGQSAQVTTVMPRILDVLNTYLRALDESDLEQPAAIQKVRAQMLRRVRLAAGESRVRDLLIGELILL